MAFPRYLLSMSIGGMAAGAAHGAWRGYRDLPVKYESDHLLKYIVGPAARDGLSWSLLGPWAPVALPLWFFYWKDVHCPVHPNRRIQ
jgi:hypothetical protein